MENVAFRVPAQRTHYVRYPNGTVVNMNELSSSRFVFRTQTGYKGVMSKTRPLPPNGYSLNFQDISATQIQGDYFYTDGRYEHGTGPILSTIPGGVTYSSVSAGDLYNRALDDLNHKEDSAAGDPNNRQSVRGGLDLSIDLAEIHRTAKMLKITEQVLDYTKTFIGRFGPIKAAGKLWLAYTYGIKPLLSSIHGIAEEHVRIVVNKTATHRGRASVKVYPKSVIINTIWGPLEFPIVGGHVKMSTTIGITVKTPEFDFSRFSSLNPLSFAWELMPLSFVGDWFLNVGGYLRNYETALLYESKFVSGYRTDLSIGKGILGEIRFKGQDATLKYEGLHRSSVRSVNIVRSVLTSYPRPVLPSLGANLGSFRLLSAASLLTQLLKGR